MVSEATLRISIGLIDKNCNGMNWYVQGFYPNNAVVYPIKNLVYHLGKQFTRLKSTGSKDYAALFRSRMCLSDGTQKPLVPFDGLPSSSCTPTIS